MFYGGQESEQSNFSTIELDQISDGPTTRELSSLITVAIFHQDHDEDQRYSNHKRAQQSNFIFSRSTK